MRSFNDYAIEAFLRHAFEGLPAARGGRLLDLGCGARPYAPLYQAAFEECIAADFEARTMGVDVRLDAQALPFRDDSFEYVLCSEVIEHVPNAHKALGEIARVLRPGGVLLVTWPFIYMLHEVPSDYARLTEFGMAKLLGENGLTIERFARRGGAFALAAVLAEFFVSGFLETLVRMPVLGRVFRLVKTLTLALIFRLPMRICFAIVPRWGLQYYRLPGEGLSGWRGQLQHWTLGYCVVARKETAR
jgi:SAM-dependent methyltransferase